MHKTISGESCISLCDGFCLSLSAFVSIAENQCAFVMRIAGWHNTMADSLIKQTGISCQVEDR